MNPTAFRSKVPDVFGCNIAFLRNGTWRSKNISPSRNAYLRWRKNVYSKSRNRLPHDISSHPKRPESSITPLWKPHTAHCTGTYVPTLYTLKEMFRKKMLFRGRLFQ